MADVGVLRWLTGKAIGLPPRMHRQLLIEYAMPMAMRDGVVLLADHIAPVGVSNAPVVLMRSPYGRGAVFGLMAKLLAERGFRLIVQSVRGTAGSGGTFNPMRQEKNDGADTVDWIRRQPWFAGKLYTFGGSYLGNVQWAMASIVPEKLDGLAMNVTLSNFRDELLGFGGYTQAGTLAWTKSMQRLTQPAGAKITASAKASKRVDLHSHLPVGTLDHTALGTDVSWWRDWTSHPDPQDPWWEPMDYSPSVPLLDAPVSMVAGWNDIFLPFQLRDFAARQTAGKPSWLTIGPWSHASPGVMIGGLKDAISFLSALRQGKQPYPNRDKVRLYLQQAKQWLEFPSWPPPGARVEAMYLRSGGGLGVSPPADKEGMTSYIYDPADPTPAIHGPQLLPARGQSDMSLLARRQDTITFISTPLEGTMDLIGPVSVELVVRSDRAHTDFFACLCAVDRRGVPLRITDGYLRLRPGVPAANADGICRITIECWPTAYRITSGHRLQLIVASGAHPRFARNLGTGEPPSTATEMVTARQEIFHSASQLSMIKLTVVSTV